MQNPIKDANNQLKELIMEALGRCISAEKFPNEPLPNFTITIPADKKNGDFATNIAMVSAKALKMPPRDIATAIVDNLVLDGSYFAKAEIAGAGFINLFFDENWYSSVIKTVHEKGDQYGRTDYGNNTRILVEFVSANPTGPMHIGNARGGAVGDSLATVLEWSGHEVFREFYINDGGNQINKFGISLEARYLQQFDPSVEVPEDAYLGEDITDHAKKFIEINGDKYVNASEEERREALVNYALPINVQTLEDDLCKYRITYDNWFRESSLYDNGEALKVVDILKEKGCTYEKDGATWFKATDYDCDVDFVLIRNNGVPTYIVPDIAYHYNKLETRGYDKGIDVLGADHHGYVPRLKAALTALGIDAKNRLDAVLMQMVKLVRDGETIKASKRSGKAITLATLLEEVPIDAARFFFNQREANSQMDFDLDLAVEESSKNPVFYVQYAHARVCSILRNLEVEYDVNSANLSLLTAPEELALIRHISTLPQEIIDSAKSYDPSRVTRFSMEVANLFHKFYTQCHVKGDDVELTKARATLCEAVQITLKNILDLLKITAPTSM